MYITSILVKKNTIGDGGSTAVETVDTVNPVDTVDTVDTVEIPSIIIAEKKHYDESMPPSQCGN